MVNFTFLANPVFSESGSGMAVAGTVAGSCTGGLVAVSIVAVLFGGVALGVGYYAYKLKVLNAQLRRNQDLIAFGRTPSEGRVFHHSYEGGF